MPRKSRSEHRSRHKSEHKSDRKKRHRHGHDVIDFGESAQNKMPLTTIGQTLEFLQREYHAYRQLDEQHQAIIREKNEEVRREASVETKQMLEDVKTLRELYIDLAMHDEMVQASMKARDRNQDRITTIMRNKIAIQQMIKFRERRLEVIVPDPLADFTALEYCTPSDPSKEKEEGKNGVNKTAELLDVLTSWVPDKHRSRFRDELDTIWKKSRDHQDNWASEMARQINQQCIVMGMRSVKDFQALIRIVECLALVQLISVDVEKPLEKKKV